MSRWLPPPSQRAAAGPTGRLGALLPWLLTAALTVQLGLVACAEPDEPSPPTAAAPAGSCECAPGAAVVDRALLAFLSKAKAVHHQADIAEADDAPAQAIAVLETLVKGPIPGGKQAPPEVREVLADTLARLAELRSAAGSFDAAKDDVKRGLALAVERTHYRGRLMEVLGVVEQRLHNKLQEDGDEAGAQQAKSRAIDAFQKAVAIQDEVIREALGDGGI